MCSSEKLEYGDLWCLLKSISDSLSDMKDNCENLENKVEDIKIQNIGLKKELSELRASYSEPSRSTSCSCSVFGDETPAFLLL